MKEDVEAALAALCAMALVVGFVLLLVKFFVPIIIISFATILAIGLLSTSGDGDGRQY